MSKNLRNIPYPDEQSIKKEIQTIVGKGLDPKASFWSYFLTMYKQVGLRYMFKDFTEILFTLIVSFVILLSFILSIADVIELKNINLYTLIFIWSPLTYMVMVYFFFINQKQKTTYEVEMTCKYNLHQLAAFRMLVFSVISMIMNGLLIYVIGMQEDVNYLYAILLSSSSLFLFALTLLYVQIRTKSRLLKIFLLIGWISGNLVASYQSTSFYLYFLNQVPFYVYGVIGISCMVLYVRSLKELLFAKKVKGLI